MGAIVALVSLSVLAPQAAFANQGGCTTTWVEGFNLGSCISDDGTDNTGYPDAYINYVPSPSTCAIHIQVWDGNNKQYSDKQVACTTGHYTGTSAGPVGSSVNLHAYARLDLNGTHFAVGDSPSFRVNGCSTYTQQGFNIGVCVNNQGTGNTAYPDIYVNSTPFPSSCAMQIQVWDNNNKQETGGQVSCATGHYLGVSAGPFSGSTSIHSYLRLDLNGSRYPGPNSPDITVMPAFVALGDSYASGEGAGPFYTGTPTSDYKCHRSNNAYAKQYAGSYYPPVGQPDLAACSGSKIADITSQNSLYPIEPPQTNVLSSGTRLVTLTVGGNDVGFGVILSKCILVGGSCWQTQLAGIDATINAQYLRLVALYQNVRFLAPNANLVVVTYPRVFPTFEPVSCPGLAGGLVSRMSQADLDAVNAAWTLMNTVIGNAATAVGATVLDETNAFAGHDICSAVPWASHIVVSDVQQSFHPNAIGYLHEAIDLYALIGLAH